MHGLITYWLLPFIMGQAILLAQWTQNNDLPLEDTHSTTHVNRLTDLFLAEPIISKGRGFPQYKRPQILASIIIDDMGNNYAMGLKALKLQGNITFSFLPHVSNTQKLARLAHRQGKEVMIHMPMQAIRNLKLGPGALTQGMSQEAMQKQIEDAVTSLPFAKGLNNHMGSLLTVQPQQMQWVMQALQPYELYFVDSRTNSKSIALKTAKQYHIPSISRHVFLDHDIDASLIEKRFAEFIRIALSRGHAVAIGHPHPLTLEYLAANIDRLEAHGIQLVPISTLIRNQQLR